MKPEHNKIHQIARLQMLVQELKRNVDSDQPKAIIMAGLNAMEGRLQYLAEAEQGAPSSTTSVNHPDQSQVSFPVHATSLEPVEAIFKRRAEEAKRERGDARWN